MNFIVANQFFLAFSWQSLSILWTPSWQSSQKGGKMLYPSNAFCHVAHDWWRDGLPNIK